MEVGIIKTRSRGIVFLVLAGVLFGTNPLMYFIAGFFGSNMSTFLVQRSLMSVLVLSFVIKLYGMPILARGKLLRDGMIASGINALCCLLLTVSYSYIDGGIATTVHFVYPMFVMLICCVMFKVKLNAMKVIALLLGTLGVAMFSGDSESVSVFGIVLALVSGVIYSSYVVFIERSEVRSLHPLQLTLYSNAVMFFVALIYAVVVGELDFSSYTPRTLVVGFLPVIVCSICGASLFQVGVRYTDSITAAMLSTLEPITAVAIGVLIMGEVLKLSTVLGCAFIVAGVIIAIVAEKRAYEKQIEPEPEPEPEPLEVI